MRVDILHVRDPDSYCDVRVFVDGKEIDYNSYSEESVDAGAGWEWEDWIERIRDAEQRPDGDYKDALLGALLNPPGDEFISGIPDCEACGKELALDEVPVQRDGEWYHPSCV